MATSSTSSTDQPRGRCVSLEGNLDDVGSVMLAAQENDSSSSHSHQQHNVLDTGDEFSYLSSIYQPRRKLFDSHDSASAAADAATFDYSKPSSNKRLLCSPDAEDDKAPPKKISRKKQRRRFTNDAPATDSDSEDSIQPTHLIFTLLPKAPRKVSRKKRRSCSAIGCSNTSFHNSGKCFLHGGDSVINPINLFATQEEAQQSCASEDEE